VTDELTRIKYIDPMISDNDGNSPLHFCSQAGHSEVVDLMIARFGDILDLNARNSTGLTPLMKAALQGRTRCAKSLLSAGRFDIKLSPTT
jgi:ankyrin repeat protein